MGHPVIAQIVRRNAASVCREKIVCARHRS